MVACDGRLDFVPAGFGASHGRTRHPVNAGGSGASNSDWTARTGAAELPAKTLRHAYRCRLLGFCAWCATSCLCVQRRFRKIPRASIVVLSLEACVNMPRTSCAALADCSGIGERVQSRYCQSKPGSMAATFTGISAGEGRASGP